MPDYLISQNDPRGERPDDGNGPSRSWRLKAAREQERIRLNLVEMRRRGRWDFVNDLQPLAPRRPATMVHENDVGGLLDYFMPVPGGRKNPDRMKTLKEFQEIFTVIDPPEVVGRSESDEYFAEMMVAGPDRRG